MEAIKKMTNGRYNCIECGKSYSRFDNAVQHFDEKHREIRKICPCCSKQIKHKNFARHIRIHSKPQKKKKIKLNCEVEIDEAGRIFSKVIDVDGQKFVLKPVETKTDVRIMEVGKINIANERKQKKSIIQDAFELAISGKDVLLSQSIKK